MYFEVIELVRSLDRYQNIFMYGTGNYAMNILHIMNQFHISEKVSGFVVSKRKDTKEIDGIPVYELDQIKEVDDDTVLFVAVSEHYSCEIRESLRQRGFEEKCLFLIDYMKKENLETWEEGRNFQELYQYIYQWCISNQIQGVQSTIPFLPEKKVPQKADNKFIVFIVGMITARTSRIVIALKKNGYRVKILKWHVGNNYVVYCIDPPWEQNVISRIMLLYKEYFGKIVLAPYDVLNFTHMRGKEENFTLEKFALENADGVVWRYFSREALREKLGFNYHGDSIDFLDYCAEYEIPAKSYCDESLKLCCLPTHTKPFLQDVKEDFGLAREATVWEIMEKIGERSDCEFHVFLWEVPDGEDLAALEKVKQQYSNFYYYVRIDHEKLIRWISEYDYGCILSIEGGIPQWPDTLNVGLEPYYTEGAYKYAAQNKFYDFLNAHLPVIATYPQKLCEVLSAYDVIIGVSLEDLDLDFLRKNRKRYYENAVQAHEKLLIDKHIYKLIDFFNKVYQGNE